MDSVHPSFASVKIDRRVLSRFGPMCERYKARLRRCGDDRGGGKARAVAKWQRFYNTDALEKFRLSKSAMTLRNRNA